MLTISKDNRKENENQFMALILHKPKLLELMQIKTKYLQNPKNRKILEYAIEYHELNKDKNFIDLVEVYKKHKDIDIEWWKILYLETVWYENASMDQFKNGQASILNHFKEDYIDELNEKLKNRKIEYSEFMQKMKQIDDVQLETEAKELKKEEIVATISEEKARINLNRFKKLDNTLKLVQGDFLIIGATTGAGKSGLMLNLMGDLMHTFQCIYFNMEMSKSTIYKRIVAIDANVKVNNVDKPETKYQAEVIQKSMNEIEKAKLIVEHKASDMTAIKNTIAQMKDKTRHTIVFIDHLGLVKIDGMKSLYEQATEVAKELRQLCLEYDCTIIGASQLNRTAYNGNITLSMLKDSGELENSASKVILLYKDETSGKDDLKQKMVFDVAKNRDGYTGVISAVYDKEKQIFSEVNSAY